MQYSNFVMKNNIHATLSTALSSIATTIQLTTGQWTRFWTEFPQIATLESFDDTWKVVKREIVQITARNDDNLTVVRAFAPCPANDDANSQSQSAISFNADDTISLYIPKEIFDKIHDSLNDIYDNGTNNMRTDFVSWLQVEVNPWSVLVWSAYYDFAGWTITLTDNATNYLEIDENWLLVNNTTARNDENTKIAIITTSSGSVTNIKDRRLWTIGWKIGGVNIHDLTEKTTINDSDEFIIADSENIYQNKKVKFWTMMNKNLLPWKNCADWSDLLSLGDSVWNFVNKKISILQLLENLSPIAYTNSNSRPRNYIGDGDIYFYASSSYYVKYMKWWSRRWAGAIWITWNFSVIFGLNYTTARWHISQDWYLYWCCINTWTWVKVAKLWINTLDTSEIVVDTTQITNAYFLWFDWTYYYFWMWSSSPAWTNLRRVDQNWTVETKFLSWIVMHYPNTFVTKTWRLVITDAQWSYYILYVLDNYNDLNIIKEIHFANNSNYIKIIGAWNVILQSQPVTSSNSYYDHIAFPCAIIP